MARSPTAAQRRIIAAADPSTGRLRGPEGHLAALVRLGLAFRHPRPPYNSYLTPAGHRWREPDKPQTGTGIAARIGPRGGSGTPTGPQGGSGTPTATETGPRIGAGTTTEPAGGVFAARTGGELAGDEGPERARQVRSAWQGLIELRRMTHPDAAIDRPCPWERAHLVTAAALALEAGGCRPAVAGTGGYRVTDTPQPEAVAVRAPTPDALHACAAVLQRAGWQPGEHRDGRTGVRYLLASPRRA